mmetsp:Transcript_38199/g.56090  ORF Transcript_38199/g.56090 Transcript_38199/m.56090 type:complete len:262 (-) Transcript_38199:270-1055(-)
MAKARKKTQKKTPLLEGLFADMTIVKHDLERDNVELHEQIRELKNQNKLLVSILEDERQQKRRALRDREKSLSSCAEAQLFLEQQEDQRKQLVTRIEELKEQAQATDAAQTELESELRLHIIHLQTEGQNMAQRLEGKAEIQMSLEARVDLLTLALEKEEQERRDGEDRVRARDDDLLAWQQTAMKLRLAVENKLTLVESLEDALQRDSSSRQQEERRWEEQVFQLTREMDEARARERKASALSARLLPLLATLHTEKAST